MTGAHITMREENMFPLVDVHSITITYPGQLLPLIQYFVRFSLLVRMNDHP